MTKLALLVATTVLFQFVTTISEIFTSFTVRLFDTASSGRFADLRVTVIR